MKLESDAQYEVGDVLDIRGFLVTVLKKERINNVWEYEVEKYRIKKQRE